MANTSRLPTLQQAVMVLLFVVLITHILYELQLIMILLSLAILFAFLLYPLAARLESWRLPQTLAALVSVIVAIGVLVGAGILFSQPVSAFVDDFPQLKEQALANMERLSKYSFVPEKMGSEWIQSKIRQLPNNREAAYKALTATSNTLTIVGLLPLFTFFMLSSRDKFRKFILQAAGTTHEAEARTVIEKMSEVSHQYMGGVFIVVFILCVVNSTGLWILGIRYAIVLGTVSAVINFIPYFGTLLGGAVVLLVTFLTSGDSNDLVAVVLFFAGIQLLENWILTPNITGHKVRINPMTTILSLMLGAMLWGIPGMIIAIPFVGMLRIVSNHIGALKPLAYLLGTEQKRNFPGFLKKLPFLFRPDKRKNE